MIGKTVLLLVSVAVASSLDLSRGVQRSSLAGVDPNTLSCDPTGQQYLLLPHDEDCSKFYMCTHGEEVEFDCPAPLIFDFELQTCNWQWAVDCVLRNETGEEEAGQGSGHGPGSSDEINGGSWENGSGEGSGWGDEPEISNADGIIIDSVAAMRSSGHETSDQAVAEINCLVPQLSSRLMAYRGDCQRFWRCSNGAAEAAFCVDGLYFNSRTLQCDFEANVPCARDALIHEEIGEEFLPY